MSTDRQRQLDEYVTPSDAAAPSVGETEDARSEPVRTPDWIEVEDDSPGYRQCQNCDSHVTPEFARVSGDNDNVVHRCPNCANNAELAHGAAGIEDFEHRVEGGLHQ